jgi:hypothetical protein
MGSTSSPKPPTADADIQCHPVNPSRQPADIREVNWLPVEHRQVACASRSPPSRRAAAAISRRRSARSSERMSRRTGWRRSSSASRYSMTSTQFYDEVGHQPVDHGVLHDHADQAGAGQVARAELRALQVLVHVPLRARNAMPGPRRPERAPMAEPGDASVDTAGMLAAPSWLRAACSSALLAEVAIAQGLDVRDACFPDGHGPRHARISDQGPDASSSPPALFKSCRKRNRLQRRRGGPVGVDDRVVPVALSGGFPGMGAS